MKRLGSISQPIPLAKLAYEKLRDSILDGSLQPGEIYNEKNLAEELGISRTPVREALLELSAQGLVTFLPRRGIIIRHFTKRDIEEVFELRNVIELAVVERVADNYQKYDFKKLQKTIEKQKSTIENQNYIDFLHVDRIFHISLCEMYGNRRLIAIMENIRDLIQIMGSEALKDPKRMEEVIDEHQKVLDFISKGLKLEAREAMEYHLERSKKAVLQYHHDSTE